MINVIMIGELDANKRFYMFADSNKSASRAMALFSELRQVPGTDFNSLSRDEVQVVVNDRLHEQPGAGVRCRGQCRRKSAGAAHAAAGRRVAIMAMWAETLRKFKHS